MFRLIMQHIDLNSNPFIGVNVSCVKSVELKVNHLKYVTTICFGAWLVSFSFWSSLRCAGLGVVPSQHGAGLRDNNLELFTHISVYPLLVSNS